jgi:hypothetical protein
MPQTVGLPPRTPHGKTQDQNGSQNIYSCSPIVFLRSLGVEDTELTIVDMHGCILTCQLYARHKIDSGTSMSGVRLDRLSLNRNSDRLDD